MYQNFYWKIYKEPDMRCCINDTSRGGMLIRGRMPIRGGMLKRWGMLIRGGMPIRGGMLKRWGMLIRGLCAKQLNTSKRYFKIFFLSHKKIFSSLC